MDFAQSIQLDPKNWRIYFKRGLFHHDLKRPAKAKQDFTTAYKLAPAGERRKMSAVPAFQGYGIPLK